MFVTVSDVQFKLGAPEDLLCGLAGCLSWPTYMKHTNHPAHAANLDFSVLTCPSSNASAPALFTVGEAFIALTGTITDWYQPSPTKPSTVLPALL